MPIRMMNTCHFLYFPFKENMNSQPKIIIFTDAEIATYEPHRERTVFLPMQKQRRRSASR